MTRLLLVLVVLTLSSCSPWVAGPMWTEGVSNDTPRNYVTWTNMWNREHSYTIEQDFVTDPCKCRFIDWVTEWQAVQKGVFEHDRK